MDHKTKIIVKSGDEFLAKAKEQLCKPEEDVVPYSVCQNAYYSIAKYLKEFLVTNGVKPKESASIEELLVTCRSFDQKFNDLHLAPLYDPKKTEDVWMNIDAARDFVKMAESTRQIVQKI